jgi:hypothetical protein
MMGEPRKWDYGVSCECERTNTTKIQQQWPVAEPGFFSGGGR